MKPHYKYDWHQRAPRLVIAVDTDVIAWAAVQVTRSLHVKPPQPPAPCTDCASWELE